MNFKTIGIPTIKLVVIAVVVTVLLVLTNSATVTKIAENNAAAAVENRKKVLEAADDFEEKTVSVDGVDYTYYEATNGAGYVFEGSNKGYGGQVVTMVGISGEGEIVGVLVTSASDETPGLGAKWLSDTEKQAQFKGAVPDDTFAVTKDGGTVQAVSGATLTSRAVTADVNSCVAQYKAVTGGAN